MRVLVFPSLLPALADASSRRIKTNTMNARTLIAISATFLGFVAPLHAGTSTYQVTGPILEVNDAKIVIQKDSEKWEISRGAATKVTGDLKVGSKVTIQYTMTATTITAKPDKDPVKAPAKAPATSPKKAK